ncbi:MAG: endolytic transglycosylase MltG [Bacillota bacterium]
MDNPEGDMKTLELNKTGPPTTLYRLVRIVVFLLLAAGLGILATYWTYHKMQEPVSARSVPEILLTIPPAATTTQIAELLYQEGLIRNNWFFRVYTRYTDQDKKLRAGEYMVSPSESLQEILNKLTKGQTVAYSFTIPEGLTVTEIADLLSRKGFVDRQRFLEQVQKGKFNFPYADQFPKGKDRLEGFLFPDTYAVPRGVTEEKIIQIMLNRFVEVYKAQLEKGVMEKGLSVRDIVTVASLVEREAKVDEERERIAGVIYNRLQIDMPLQIDATVLYALGGHKPQVTYEDLATDSPYNTYKYKGLPPGPIANPGLKSLHAALNPEIHKYFYYVVKSNGAHQFSKTLEEHNAARRRYLASRNKNGK